ncbi:EcsC family protein [Methylocaldum szegediense]|uniref:EcsC family protein n=1 Tax=Methylocaldum szegediense TaxID=73780 RepID=A0ABM9HWG4_9GAMM|nr:EcsC family protein [Methylocaldum szegediense]CAI8722902.1 EcsC family protein [Methylocaldum szegediense]
MKLEYDCSSPRSGVIELAAEDRRRLREAFRCLEYPSFAAHLAHVVGTPVDKGLKLIPPRWHRHFSRLLQACMARLLDVAVTCLGPRRLRSERYYRRMARTAGVIGGFLGGSALLVELPITTLIMLAAIAEIARSEGEDLNRLETRLAGLEVFALGGRSKVDDAADTGYYGLRLALEAAVKQASRQIAEQGLSRKGAPAISRMILIVSEQFGLTLSEKAAAEMLPLVGAVGGAFINDLFVRHFQSMARSHFVMRRLERRYGRSYIEAEYRKLKSVRHEREVDTSAMAARSA